MGVSPGQEYDTTNLNTLVAPVLESVRSIENSAASLARGWRSLINGTGRIDFFACRAANTKASATVLGVESFFTRTEAAKAHCLKSRRAHNKMLNQAVLFVPAGTALPHGSYDNPQNGLPGTAPD